jgi:vacuolar-type H+-ATPase subunit H
VPQVRDFLDRFRPAGAPGAASAGVPVDRAGELAAELAPVLALLTDTNAECGRLIASAERDARRIVAEARTQAAAVTADAGRRARSAREEAARQALAEARAEAAEAEAAAGRQAALVRELAAERMPALVSQAVSLVRNLPEPTQADAGQP